ncbi:hypothetical protein [Polaribacter staleyi]|uniref:hypothetical protein n=1 Tax=Polaribacter staleyi TaxID=2022337 RepID=UPI0031B9B12D
MKLLKSFLILFIAISITSCSSDDDNSFELSAVNLAGTYKITAYKSVEIESATSSAGKVITLATTTKTRSSSTVKVILNANNTYSIDGILVMTSKTDGVDNDDDIQDLDDTAGTYALNLDSKTITLTETLGNGLVIGTFDLKTFNADKLIIKQDVNSTTKGGNDINTVTDITLERN